jgi:RimJ/RimL family protein N-acetyltransferase
MEIEPFTLRGTQIRLEPLETRHVQALIAAKSGDPGFYRWATVPRTEEQFRSYIEQALSWRKEGHAHAFAIVRLSDDRVVGTTRYFAIERWAWPEGHPRRGLIDGCEIGYTWLSPLATRTAVNSEAKLLLLTHAFENWQAHRVCFHTDVRNVRSAAALERIGAKLEGTLRAHRLAVDLIPRDSLRYSITAKEWPDVKARLAEKVGFKR